jgi:hypothetical protein
MVGIAVVAGLGAFVFLVLAVLVFVKSDTIMQQQGAIQIATLSGLSFVAMVVALSALTPRTLER